MKAKGRIFLVRFQVILHENIIWKVFKKHFNCIMNNNWIQLTKYKLWINMLYGTVFLLTFMENYLNHLFEGIINNFPITQEQFKQLLYNLINLIDINYSIPLKIVLQFPLLISQKHQSSSIYCINDIIIVKVCMTNKCYKLSIWATRNTLKLLPLHDA